MKQETALTPLMKQYFSIKEQYSDALVLFQVGDFYELFYDDAIKAAQFLGITLTARGKNNGDPIPLCGVPVHALDHYLRKLIKGGFHIAICDQLEVATPGKVVERGVTKVYTPGTLTDTSLLDEKSASYVCFFYSDSEYLALLFAELLTAQLFSTVVSHQNEKIIETELLRFNPDEIIVTSPEDIKKFNSIAGQYGFCTTLIDQQINSSFNENWLDQQFKRESLPIIKASNALQQVFKMLYIYFKKNNAVALEQFRHINFYKSDDYLLLDSATQRHLQLVRNEDGSRINTLFSVIDDAVTAMGSRTIKKWILRPLMRKDSIMHRQEAVEIFKREFSVLENLRDLLKRMGDFERTVGRIALRRASLRDYIELITALQMLPRIKLLLIPFNSFFLINCIEQSIGDFNPLERLLQTALNDDDTKDWIINSGFDQRLDYIRQLIDGTTQSILQLEKREQESTGINSLKVRYNQVHGYYIEITKPNLSLVPVHYIRHQTLVGKERFTTPELKKLEVEINSARTEIENLEYELFEKIKIETSNYLTNLRKAAQATAQLDALLSFSYTAYQRNYVKPEFNEEKKLQIKEGKHPVVEKKLAHYFIANDINLTEDKKVLIITGPNMGGKSTFLRQTALISIMAQCGAFVPASHATLPIIDKIFTRIGAADNVAEGKSTFFVEMEETAFICAHATNNSLVILDEIGRGTSTFDGLAIAQAVIEYLHHHVKSYCLFATHYHELTKLAVNFPTISNYHAASKKTESGIILLYKILPGIAQGSFGIEVAKLAELPNSVIARAKQLLQELSMQSYIQSRINDSNNAQEELHQLRLQHQNLITFFDSLKQIDYESLSPKLAFDLLWQFKEKIKELS